MTDTHALLQLITATLGSLGFSLIFNVRGRALIFTTLGGFLSWGSYLLLGLTGLGVVVRYLLSSILITIYAELCARLRKAPATVFLVSAAIPLIPGSSLYATMVYALHRNGPEFLRQGLFTLLLAGAISAGIILVSTVMHAFDVFRRQRSPRP